ncbi:hypothetical protein, partial [uncultured Hyphomonas sp.]|uniref:hypothetical protein n=1 Tax=uncultured Hyphomonas sp. TaxID=225298 RepID=UPI0026386958
MRPVTLTISLMVLATILVGCETSETAQRAPASVEVVTPDPGPSERQDHDLPGVGQNLFNHLSAQV